ncbi:Prephenate dehydratase [Ignisphaera aggregans DSM 17230]|uniref:prephenate dehydratase n=1 Tax=Ignisphaera aggregans (strain DSM 17230 / JCM 13409 / AQ1.S1) TaxID=583356 RepID=E0SR40_IGNAA|nr:Prephenate dehydratase [Ignisphaera aggregans DSM 17230]
MGVESRDVETLMNSLDVIDRELIELMIKRIELLRRLIDIAGVKRFSEMLGSLHRNLILLGRNQGLDEDYISIISSYINGLAVKMLKPLRVSFLGPRASFSEEAVMKIFGDMGVELLPQPSIREVFRSVEEGDSDYGVVPIENSIEGSVGETIDHLVSTKLFICGETELRIKLNLIARPGTRLEDIKVVLSHPHALAQCRNFIETRLKGVKIEARSSTSEAVREAVESYGVAAIGSEYAAKLYGGEILVSGIEDYRDNFTRFIVIGRNILDRGIGLKTSLIFATSNIPGALYRALEPFAIRGINLTKIESRPIKGRPWEYMFYVEFEGSINEERCAKAVDELKNRTTFLKILGTYKRIP